MSSEEKTEDASAHKLREARKRGEVAVSRDLAAAVGFIVFLLALWMLWSHLAERLRRLMTVALDVTRGPLDGPAIGDAIESMVVDMAWIVVPLLVSTAVASTLTTFLQTKGLVSAEPLKFDFRRMSPGTFIERVFSTRQLMELLKMLFKFCLLGGVMFVVFRSYLSPLATSMHTSAESAFAICLRALAMLLGVSALAFLVLGLLDYGHQFFEYLKDQRMSKSERKREYRDNEGDPYLKAELRSLRREMLESAGKLGLNRASVVVTNPTHFAVALYYEPGAVELPVVVAKGEDADALQMRSDAKAQAIPVMEYPPLARSLYAAVPVGSSIGDEHVEAVAEVFRWVNRLKHNGQTVEVGAT